MDSLISLADTEKMLNERAEQLISYLQSDNSEDAEKLLQAADVDQLPSLLRLLPVPERMDAFLLLDKQVALNLLRWNGGELTDYFMYEMRSAQVSELVEKTYTIGSSNDSVTALPDFVIQKILTHGGIGARKIIADSISGLVKTKQLSKLKAVLIELNPVDVAGIIDDFKDDDLLKIFRLMPKDMASEVFVYLPQEISEQLINLLSESEVGQIIDDLYADDAADLLEEMPSKVVKKLLSAAKPETRAAINHLLQYKEDSAGSIMTPEFVDLKEDNTVAQSIERIRRDGVDKETINNCYVLDSERKLVGMVTLRKLLLSKPDDKIRDLMEINVIAVRTSNDQEEVADLFRRYGFMTMPVCDSEFRLVGIVTADDIMTIIHEEALDDVSLINKVTPSRGEYLKTTVLSIWMSRIPWLLVLMVSATFTGLIISNFEHTLALLSSALFAYIPMLMDTGGNAGQQSAATIIRGMALGEIEWRDKFKVLLKEFSASLLLGLTMSAACFIKVIFMDQFIYANVFDGWANAAVVGAIISLAVFCAIVIAKLIGSILPMLSKKLRLDPAVVSSPFITTIVDALALLLYCFIAIAILG